MSGTTEVFVNNIPVVADVTGVKVLGFNFAGQYRAIEPAALGGNNGGGEPSGEVVLSNATPVGLGTAAPGVALTASRADHTHPLPTAVQVGAALTVHTHTLSDIPNLQLTLDGKAQVSHTHTIAAVSGLQNVLDGKAPTAHQHPMSDVSGLLTILDTKENASAKGNPLGYAPLDETGRVPSNFLPAGTGTGGGGGGGTIIDSGTADGQIAVWSLTESRLKWQTPAPITADRTPTVERNSPTVMSFLDYNRRNIVLSGNAPMTLAASEIGVAPNQGMEFVINNRHTAVNTLTFGAGIIVDAFPAGSGTAGSVKVGVNGLVAVMVYPVGTTLVASVRGQIV